MNNKTTYLTLTLLTLLCFAASAQVPATPYYISLNSASPSRVHEVSDRILNLTYDDRQGKAQQLPMKIYDWKRNLVTTISLGKTLGVNNFTINLDDLAATWELGKLYTVEVKDEAGHKYELPLRLVAPPVKETPAVNIVVNPVTMTCDGITQPLVEYYGAISGGKAPYAIIWYVLNATRTEFLYQPKDEIVQTAGQTSFVQVASNPEYYVVFFVKDACGMEKKNIVNVVCDDGTKKINTIFVEELDSELFRNNPSIR